MPAHAELDETERPVKAPAARRKRAAKAEPEVAAVPAADKPAKPARAKKAAPVAEAEAAVDTPAPSWKRAPRKAKAAADAPVIDAPVADPVEAEAALAAPEPELPLETAVEAPPPARKRAPRKPKAEAGTPVEVAQPAAIPTATVDAELAEAASVAAESSQAAPVAPEPELPLEAAVEAPAPKRRRASRKPKADALPEVARPEAVPVAETLAMPASAEPIQTEPAATELTEAEPNETVLASEPAPHVAETEQVPSPAHADHELASDGAIAVSESQAEAAPSGFGPLGLSPEILRAVEEMGYRDPTPIQAQAIPVVFMGRDVLGCAQTGTGKTASFVLPLMDILSGSRARARMPRSLILEPTRELALQVAENFVKYGKYQKLTHALLIGGESLSDQKETLMRGVDVLIATPGRLMDMFERGGLLLTDTRILVIDEADRMLDMGFIPDVEKIVGFLPRNRQTLFFSATMAPEIRRLADAFLTNPKEITVSRPASVASTIVAGLTVVPELEKREALRRLIRSEDVQNALIFCNRKVDVDMLYKSLRKHGFSVGALHGDMSQPERFATLSRFKAGEIRLLVCSDVAARGLDIGGLSHVFNFDVPIHAEDYVHRIGRTGRAGMTGHAFTLASPDDEAFVAAIEKLVGAPIPRMQVEGIDAATWSEDGGRRGRGRGRGRVAAKEPIRTPKPAEAERPRRERERRPDAPASVAPELAAPEIVAPPAPRAEPARGDAAHSDRGRGRRGSRRDEPRPVEARGERFRDRPRDQQPRDRRDDDLGSNVVGFGDDVPAFMLLRSRRSRAGGDVQVIEQEA